SPAGGYVLWVELPAQVDAMRLYQLALEQGITIGPGYMFSITDSYRNFVRLNYGSPWSPEIERAVVTVGKLATACLG
ncbi:2-aminoadipate aminotransferase, partial [Burkholderia anthina]|nr:2-aminoadipate aminotransferase [Burkholderia anthina]